MPTMAPCPLTASSTWAISAGSWADRNRYIPRPVPAAGVKVIVGSGEIERPRQAASVDGVILSGGSERNMGDGWLR